MSLLAMILAGIVGFEMPDCMMDKAIELGPWSRRLIESKEHMRDTDPDLSGLYAELWNGGCKSGDPRLEPALDAYLSRIVRPFPVDGPYIGLAKVLAELRVRSSGPDEAVRLLMSDSQRAASLEPRVGGRSHAALSHVPSWGYRLLLVRGHAEAVRKALSSSDRRVLVQVFSGMWLAGSDGADRGGTRLKDAIVALYSSEDVGVQRGAVRSTRWVTKSAEEFGEMLGSFLSMEGRSEEARAEARRQLKLGWR